MSLAVWHSALENFLTRAPDGGMWPRGNDTSSPGIALKGLEWRSLLHLPNAARYSLSVPSRGRLKAPKSGRVTTEEADHSCGLSQSVSWLGNLVRGEAI